MQRTFPAEAQTIWKQEPSIRIHLLYFRDMLRFMVLTIIRDTAPVTVRALALVQDMAQVLDLVRDTNKLLPRLSF